MTNPAQPCPSSVSAADLVELSLDAISLYDDSGNLVFANDRARALFGYDTDGVPSTATQPALKNAFAAALANGLWAGELDRPGLDGRTIRTLTRCKRLPQSTGQAQILVLDTDLTEKGALEQQFLKAQRLLPMGQLAGGIAHDFNNLLAVMRGHAELVLMRPDTVPDHIRGHLSDIITAAERATDLTRQLLTYSRKQLLTPQRVNVNDLLKGLGKMLHRALGERMTLECDYGADLPQVNADPGMLEQVVMNFVLNARAAMQDGGPIHLLSRAINTPPPGSCLAPGLYVAISVRDTGLGMPPGKLSQVLASAANPALENAAGFGLSAAHRIARLHGGAIHIESQPEKGTVATLLLPAIPEPLESPTTMADKGGTETILLVEPDLGVRVVSRKVLEAYGYKVLEAASGDQALAMIDSSRFDLIVTELTLPGQLGGAELIQATRTLKPGIKALVTSGHSAEAVAHSLATANLQGTPVVRKTGSTKALLEGVRRILDQ